MALSSTPTLLEINAELGTTNQSLVACISNAGKTGVFDSQMDFAGYSNTYISITPASVSLTTNSYSGSVTVTSSGTWVVDSATVPYWVTVNTSSGSSGEKMYYSVSANGGIIRTASIKIMLQSNAVYKIFNITQDGIK
jgi:hypothetical protein